MKMYETPSVGLQLGEQVEDAGLHRDVERRGRLVADHERRLPGEGAGDGDALLLAARQLARAAPRGARLDPHAAASSSTRRFAGSPCEPPSFDRAAEDGAGGAAPG